MQADDVIEIETAGLTFVGPGAGDGRPVLLLHGFPDTPFTFRPLIDQLAGSGYRAFAPALRGYPPTGGDGPYTIATLAEDAIAMVEAIGATESEPAFIVGHDWGGLAACAAAAARPEILEKVVVISVPHPTVMGARFLAGDYDQLKRSWYMFLFQLGGLPEVAVSANGFEFIERLMLDWSPRLVELEGRDEIERRKQALAEPGALSAALSYYRSMFSPGQSSVIGPVTNPALVIFGSDDGCISPSVCQGMEPFFTGGHELVEIPDAGHFVHSEQAEMVGDVIVDFLTDSAG